MDRKRCRVSQRVDHAIWYWRLPATKPTGPTSNMSSSSSYRVCSIPPVLHQHQYHFPSCSCGSSWSFAFPHQNGITHSDNQLSNISLASLVSPNRLSPPVATKHGVKTVRHACRPHFRVVGLSFLPGVKLARSRSGPAR